jgi:hypothetical protein
MERRAKLDRIVPHSWAPVASACNPTWETEIRRIEVRGQLLQIVG